MVRGVNYSVEKERVSLLKGVVVRIGDEVFGMSGVFGVISRKIEADCRGFTRCALRITVAHQKALVFVGKGFTAWLLRKKFSSDFCF